MMSEPAHTHRLKIEIAQASDPGRDPNKQVNEDSCGYAETRFGHLLVLCDGMGGHYGGQEASRTAITTIFEVFEQTPPTVAPASVLKASIEEAGRRVYLLGGPQENRARPGSTVVAMLLHDRGVDVAHVGDSRAYVIRSNQIYPLTRDHSMVQGMIDAGMLSEEQAIGHPDANKITRALGMRPEVEVEVRPEPMELFGGDLLLQSSDGLTDLALGADILNITLKALAAGSASHACNVLVQTANERGGHDNITVQIARIVDVGAKARHTIPGGPTDGAPYSEPAMTPKMTPVEGPAVPLASPAAALPLPAPPRATVDMTKPEMEPHGPSPALMAGPAAGLAAAGSPVLPTANDMTPPPAGVGLHGTHIMPAMARAQAESAALALQTSLAGVAPPAHPAPGAAPLAAPPQGAAPLAAPAPGAAPLAAPALGAAPLAVPAPGAAPLAPTLGPLTPTAPPAPVGVAPTQGALTPTAPPAPAGPAPTHITLTPTAQPGAVSPGSPLLASHPALASHQALPVPSPTVAEAPHSNRPWGAGQGAPLPAAVSPIPSPALAHYQEGSPAALPLPPPAMGLRPGFGGPSPQATGPYAGAAPSPYTPAPVSTTTPERPMAKGGIVFLIIGLSAVIAVLILVVIWALCLR